MTDMNKLAEAMHDAAIRYANGHAVDFQHEAREFILESASQPGGAWQPIETAPHEEQLLLAAELDFPGDWRIKVGYYEDDGKWRVYGSSWQPTHWMPLPAAPSAGNGRAEDK